MHIFLNPSFSAKFENIFLEVDSWNFACPSLAHPWLIIRVKIFPYTLPVSHSTSATSVTDDRQMTTAQPLLKYSQLKIASMYLNVS